MPPSSIHHPMSQKLRASCNACNQAKVKCTKTRPTCARCAKHGDIECVYSVSLRAGKRPALAADARFKQFSQPLIDSTGNNFRYNSAGNCTELRENDARSRSPGQPAMDMADEWNLTPSATADLMALDNDMYMTMIGYEKPPLDTQSLFDTSSSSPSSSLCPNSASYESLQETWYQHPPEATIPAQYPFQHRRQASILRPTPPSPKSPSHSPSISIKPSVCHCFRTVLTTLSNLQIFSSSQCHTFDVALARNKEAVTLCHASLRCICPGDTTLLLLICSLIEKILSIYQTSCSAWSQNTPQSSTSRVPTSATARVTLGVYNLDQEDENCIKMEFVRMELRKVEALVTRLKERVSPGLAEYEVKMIQALIMFLDGRLRMTYDILLMKQGNL
jgi:hypothetical protein